MSAYAAILTGSTSTRKSKLLRNIFIHVFLERGEGREKERKRNIDQLPVTDAMTGD